MSLATRKLVVLGINGVLVLLSMAAGAALQNIQIEEALLELAKAKK